MCKPTLKERELQKEINRLKKQSENLLKEICSLQFDVYMYKNMADELKRKYSPDYNGTYFLLEEIGFDTSIESKDSLISVANHHCNSYPRRTEYLPINTVDEAIYYFENNGFKVKKVTDYDG